MSEKILVPALGESITEATIVKWLKAKGETVESTTHDTLGKDKISLDEVLTTAKKYLN